MSKRFSVKLLVKRSLRLFHPNSRTRVAIACRLVVDRCRAAKNDVKDVTYELSRGLKRVQAQLSCLGGGASEFEALITEFEFSRDSLSAVARAYHAALLRVSEDSTVQTCLTKLSEIRSKLALQESAYYSVRPGNFSAAFIAACDLRTATALSEKISREISDHLNLAIFRILANFIFPISDLSAFSASPLPLPSLADLIADLNFSDSADFAQAVRDFAPPPSAAPAGVVMANVLGPQDSLPLTRGEVLQVLGKIHSFVLVRRCLRPNDLGLVPLDLIRPYDHPAVRPTANILSRT